MTILLSSACGKDYICQCDCFRTVQRGHGNNFQNLPRYLDTILVILYGWIGGGGIDIFALSISDPGGGLAYEKACGNHCDPKYQAFFAIFRLSRFRLLGSTCGRSAKAMWQSSSGTSVDNQGGWCLFLCLFVCLITVVVKPMPEMKVMYKAHLWTSRVCWRWWWWW